MLASNEQRGEGAFSTEIANMTEEGGEEMSNYSTDYERGIPQPTTPTYLVLNGQVSLTSLEIRHCVPSIHPWALKIYLTIMGTYPGYNSLVDVFV